MAEPQSPATPDPVVSQLVEQVFANVRTPENQAWLQGLLENAVIEIVKFVAVIAGPVATPIGVGVVTGISEAEAAFQPALERLARDTMKSMTGVDVGGSVTNFAGAGQTLGGAQRALGSQMLQALISSASTSGGTQLEPSTAAAEEFVGMMTNLSMRGWMKGAMFELAGLGQLEQFGELDDILVAALGLNRMSRGVMRPISRVLIQTPAEWDMNRRYRPALLSAGDVARQVARGRMSRDAAIEELARQGWSDTRIEALLNAVAKFHSVADVYLLEKSGQWSHAQAVQHLRDQGYEPAVAELELAIEQLRAIASFERSMANAAIDAYADGRIDGATLDQFTHGVTLDNQEGRQLRELAQAKRALRVAPLSASEARRLVLKGIASVIDYRRALERDGREPEAVIMLELELRADLQLEKELDAARQAAAEDKARLLAERAAEKAERRAALEAARALDRRGGESDLEDAAIRGLIPIDRVVEVYRAKYDADTVDILVDVLEEKRAASLEAQRRRDDAAQRSEGRGLSIGELEAAVFENVLSLADYRRRLEQQGLDAGDVEILTATLAAQKKARDDARAQRDQAATKATTRSIDLGRFEQLVLRGVRSIAEYQALLGSLAFDEAAIANMTALLALRLADAAAQQAARTDAGDTLRARGLSLEEFRRAVLLGQQSIDDYQAFLMGEGFTVDKQRLLLAELADAVAAADAARARRDAGDAGREPRAIPLASIRRAARLGLIHPTTYADRLAAAGWGDDDIAIEMELLLVEIAEVQAARAARDQAIPPATDKGLSLSELARAVKRGLKSLEDFRARAIELGLTKDAADTQVRILGDELRETAAAKARRAELGVELEGSGISLADLEAAVTAGALTIDGFIEQLELAGLVPVDAELLGAVLLEVLDVA